MPLTPRPPPAPGPSPDRLPSLKAIRCFEVAARHGSFTTAAAELHVTQGAVSRLIQTLEDDLGVTLFDRQGRTLRLTTTGEAYARQVRGALEQIAAASRAVRRSRDSGLVRVNVLPTFALRWLVPRLHRFRARCPDVLVDVTSSEAVIDFRTDPVDVAVRNGLGPWPTATAHRLMEEDVGLFCSPGLAAGITPQGVAAVLALPLLYHSTRPDGWAEFCTAIGHPVPDLTNAPAFEHFFMIIEAAAAGMGVGLLPLFLARAEVAAGRLVQPTPQVVRRTKAYYLLHAPGAGRNGPVRAFCDWLREEVAADATMPNGQPTPE